MLITPNHFTRRSFLNRSGNLLGGMLIGATAFSDSSSQAANEPLEKLIEEFYAAYEELDTERILNLLTDDCFFEDPTFHLIARGKPKIRVMIESSAGMLSNVKVAIENRIVCRDWVITQQTLSGIIKPKASEEGKQISVRGATIFGFKKDKINRWSDYYDFATFLKQTGQTSNV